MNEKKYSYNTDMADERVDEYKVIKLDKTDYNFISFINDLNDFDENAISLPLLSGQDIDRFSKEIKAMVQDKSIKDAMNEIYKYLLGESNDLDLQFQKEKDKAEKTGKKVGVQIGMKAGKKAERIKIAKRMLIDDMKIYKVNKYTGLSNRVLKKLKLSLNK